METIISRDITNTRMRDFYDIYILTTTRRNDFDVRTLKTALERTTAKRETELNYDELAIDLYRIFSDKGLMKLWTNYQKKFTYSQDISWKLIEEKIMELFNGICALK